ncbi:MAG: hypothetical protein ABSC29_02610 [Minisyncoccia bacterium]|jgi:hypothetical protein
MRKNPFEDEQRQRCDRSYAEVQKLLEVLNRYKATELAPGIVVERVECHDDEAAKRAGREIHEFYGKFFTPEEQTDSMAYEIGIKYGLTDNYAARNAEGKLITLLQTASIEIPGGEPGTSEIALVVWYVATDPEYKGQSLMPDLIEMALRGSLEKAKTGGKEMGSFIGEAEPEVEKLFNRFGLKRFYYEKSDGALQEVPYEFPPEDDSEVGAPAHLMMRFFDGTEKLPLDRLGGMVDALHAEYTHSQYFTPDYLKFVQEWYNQRVAPDEQDHTVINKLTAGLYHRQYNKIVENMRKLFNDRMRGVREVFSLSGQERSTLLKQGKTILDWGNVMNPKRREEAEGTNE